MGMTMAEEAAGTTSTARKTSRTVKDATPVSIGPDPTGQGEILSEKPVEEATLTAEDIRTFIKWRTAKLYKPRLGGNIGGGQAIEAQRASTVLKEFAALAEWLELGRPGGPRPLSDEELSVYRTLKANRPDIDLGPEIEAQL